MSNNNRDTSNETDRLDILRADLPRACTDERAAVEFLERQRWGDTPACPRCGDTDVYQMVDRKTRNTRYLWKCNGCAQQYTVRIGTVFEDSRIPLKHWCYAFWAACASKKGVPALQIRRQTRVSYKSALFMMHRIRYAMTAAPREPKLDGVVEADETYVGGKFRNMSLQARRAHGMFRGRPGKQIDNKVPVVAVVARGGNVRASVVPVVTAHNVGAILRRYVAPSARLMTDEANLYERIGMDFVEHESVKHSIQEYVRGEVHTNTVEGFFAQLKRQLYGTHHAVSKRHLHRYVTEAAFKWNTRKQDDGERVVTAIRGAEGKRLMYRQPLPA